MNKISYEEFTKRYKEKMEPHKNKRVSFDGEGEMFRVYLSQMIMEEWKEEQLAKLLKDWDSSLVFIDDKVNKTEAMNIFNELLSEWYWDEHTIINDRSVGPGDEKELEVRKAEYIKKIKKALGVE